MYGDTSNSMQVTWDSVAEMVRTHSALFDVRCSSSSLEKDDVTNNSKTHKRLKERCLIGRNRTKRTHFQRNPLFQATYNIKTEKEEEKINSAYLVSVR